MTDENLLPQRVVMPTDKAFAENNYHLVCWRYCYGTLEHLSNQIDVSLSDRLGKPAWSAFEIRVDDEPVVIDFSDFIILSNVSGRFTNWLRFQHNPAFEPYPNLGSFPPCSFVDWDEFYKLREMRYDAGGDKIVYKHSSLDRRLPGLVRRRKLAGEILRQHYAERLDTGFMPQKEYFQRCTESLVVVHVPGSHPHILDRSVQQMFGLGVCVISPDIWTTCLEERPVAGQHYLMLRDDYADLPEKIEWCLDNRLECAEIGRQAQQFFDRHCLPDAIWRYVKARVDDNRLQG